MKTTLLLLAGFSLSVATAQETISKVDVSIFPKPEKGYKMMVIEVPHSNLDAQKKIEFFAGKYMETDSCNRHGLSGSFDVKDLQGWGYNYYVLKTDGNVFSTQMKCGDNKMINQFVSGPSQLISYNGKMPIVIYVPEDIDVHFKIYEANKEEFKAANYKFKK
ncbi:MAG TPA: ecotin family protein [Flavobacterium sp.]|nr:ecotin family protein [Flavobacterium sp.]